MLRLCKSPELLQILVFILVKGIDKRCDYVVCYIHISTICSPKQPSRALPAS